MARLVFHRSPEAVPAEYDAIIPGGGFYYIGIFRTGEGSDWQARILSKDLHNKYAGFEFSARTKRELVSWLNRHQDQLRAATLVLDS